MNQTGGNNARGMDYEPGSFLAMAEINGPELAANHRSLSMTYSYQYSYWRTVRRAVLLLNH